MTSPFSVQVEAVKHGMPNFVAKDIIQTCESQVAQYVSLCEVMDKETMSVYAKAHGIEKAVQTLENMAPNNKTLSKYKAL